MDKIEEYHKRTKMDFDEQTLADITPILEGMPGGLFIYCADGDEELLYVNNAVIRTFGCKSEEEFRELTGYTFKGMVHPDDIDEVERSIKSQIANSIYDFDYVEYRIIKKDGTIRWIEDYGHFMHTDTYGDIFYVFINDSTERLRNRMSELEKKQKLLKTALSQAQTANIARNTFLQNMSHDIRTPLNAIIGFAELARKHKEDHDRIDNYLAQIRIAGEQLLAIVNESLEVTRVESGKVYLVENIVMLSDLLAELERAVEHLMEMKAIHFTIDKSQVQHGVVHLDYLRMKEILFQLLDNAVKYTEQNGSVKLTVIEKDMQLNQYAQFQFIVEDDGRGISPEFRDDLFQPFKRENNTTKSGVLGTGLGLSVVKSLVDLMEGSIKFESEVGQGSKFIVNLLLKVHEELAQEDPKVPELNIDLSRKRILLVEDNEINCEIAQELLMDEGYIVETANDGSVALEMVKNAEPQHYSLILMDIQMPIMDGHKATRAIRNLENRELANIPIIALSANAFAEDYKRSIEAGMDAHVPKPIDIDELQETIRKVLSGYGR